MKECRKKGTSMGGYTLFGYKVENKKILIDEEKAEIVRFIYQQYAANYTVREIMQTLSEKGITYRGKPFVKSTVYNTLKNEKYSGVYHHKGEEFTNIFPRIVPETIFNIVKQKVIKNRVGKRSKEIVYLLREKMVCGLCGCTISAETGTARNGDTIRYYKCSRRKRGSECQKTALKKDVLESLVVDTTCQILNNPENVQLVADKVLEVHRKRLNNHSILNVLLKEQSELTKSINNIMSAIEKGIITNSTKQRLNELESKQAELNEKIAIEKVKDATRLTKDDIARYIKTALKKEPRQMLNLLIKQIVLYNDRIEITYKYTDKSHPDDNDEDGFILYSSTFSIETVTMKHEKTAQSIQILCRFSL